MQFRLTMADRLTEVLAQVSQGNADYPGQMLVLLSALSATAEFRPPGGGDDTGVIIGASTTRARLSSAGGVSASV